MAFQDKFCPSPWFHMRITNSGDLHYCRWAPSDWPQPKQNIKNLAPVAWFQSAMSPVRHALLQGESLPGCKNCHVMEQHGKISGRQRQLLKIGVRPEYFAKGMISSEWYPKFQDSWHDQGSTQQWPQDWQIDLGNYCNSACVFCAPEYSSRLASEFKKIGLIQDLPPPAWCDDPVLLEKFIRELSSSPTLQYLHFIGGETLITPAFQKILVALTQAKLHDKVALGFTTNLTTWDQRTVDLLCQFKEINLGMSIECVTTLNDYLRYGSDLAQTLELMQRWISVGKQHNWFMQIRSTPTVLSMWHLDTLYRLAMAQAIPIESCNFLDRPAFMRPSVLPPSYRHTVVAKLQALLSDHSCTASDLPINSRSTEFCGDYMAKEIKSYVAYLNDQPDESWRLPDLVAFLKRLEASRKNCIIDYLPEYESILRAAGY